MKIAIISIAILSVLAIACFCCVKAGKESDKRMERLLQTDQEENA